MHLKMDNHRFGDFLPTVDDFRDPEIKKNFETADVFNDKGHDENVAGDTRVLENPTLTRWASPRLSPITNKDIGDDDIIDMLVIYCHQHESTVKRHLETRGSASKLIEIF